MNDQPADPKLEEFLSWDDADRLAWVRGSTGAPASHLERIRILLSFARPRTCVPGMLAFYLSCVTLGVAMSMPVLAGLFVTFLYSAAANLYNAFTDIREDNKNIPTRVYMLGVFGRQNMLRTANVTAMSMTAISLAVNWKFLLLTVVSVAIAHQYSMRPLRLKTKPIWATPTFALDVSLPYAMWAVVVDKAIQDINPQFWIVGAYLFIWFSAKSFVKNLPDYDGDKAAGIVTTATIARTRRRAAAVAATVTVVVYCLPTLMSLVGTLPSAFAWTALWIPVASLQAKRMLQAEDPQAANDMLRTDMVVSIGFIGTMILIADTSSQSFGVVIGAVIIVFVTDRLKLDNRRRSDIHTQATKGIEGAR